MKPIKLLLLASMFFFFSSHNLFGMNNKKKFKTYGYEYSKNCINFAKYCTIFIENGDFNESNLKKYLQDIIIEYTDGFSEIKKITSQEECNKFCKLKKINNEFATKLLFYFEEFNKTTDSRSFFNWHVTYDLTSIIRVVCSYSKECRKIIIGSFADCLKKHKGEDKPIPNILLSYFLKIGFFNHEIVSLITDAITGNIQNMGGQNIDAVFASCLEDDSVKKNINCLKNMNFFIAKISNKIMEIGKDNLKWQNKEEIENILIIKAEFDNLKDILI